MKTYFSFQPHYFNNNGDQGNLEVLKFLLKKKRRKFNQTDDPKTSDFLLVGDASQAVMGHFQKDLAKLRKVISQRYEKGQATLLVGSAYEFFAEDLGLAPSKTTRQSAFVMSESYFGYRNSDSTLPVIHIRGSFIATSLFGPVLAKNPELLRSVLRSLDCELDLDPEVKEWIEAIRRQGA